MSVMKVFFTKSANLVINFNSNLWYLCLRTINLSKVRIQENKFINRRTLIIVISLLFSLFINIQSTVNLLSQEVSKTEYGFLSKGVLFWFMGIILMFFLSWGILSFNLIWRTKISFRNHYGNILLSVLGNIVIVIMILSLHLTVSKKLEVDHLGKTSFIALIFGWSVVTSILILISRSIQYQQQKESDQLEKEELKSEKLRSELNELKSFMNPHFLFNSLNTLNALILIDQDKAVLFSSHLSRLYRYILQSKDKDLVSIEDEMFFLDSYDELLKIRFSNYFNLNIQWSPLFKIIQIPVLSIQILIENAVKHNEISKDNPLEVKIFLEDDYLVVSHVLCERRNLEESMGNGISGLSKRCKILLNKDLVIRKDTCFTVKVPILN